MKRGRSFSLFAGWGFPRFPHFPHFPQVCFVRKWGRNDAVWGWCWWVFVRGRVGEAWFFGVSTEGVKRVNDGTLWEVFCNMRKHTSRNRLTRGWHGRGCLGYEKTLTAWLSVRVLEICGSLSGIWTRVTRMKTWRPDQTRRRDHFVSFLTLQN